METTPMVARSGPKDVFMHLMVFVALYVSVISLIALLFQYINYAFPDQLNYYYQSILSSIRWSSSVLIVMFPVYLGVSYLINKDAAANPDKLEMKVRKWLIYLTLFASALTVIIDVITLIYNFLGGDLTISFFLKILAVLLVAAAVFGYYIWELKRGAAADHKQRKTFAILASVLILGAVIAGFVIVGSPAKQRALRFDETRVSNLQEIQSQIINYWQQKQALPATLADLEDSISGFAPAVDPESGAAYEYSVKSGLNFELCATFNQPSISAGDSKAIQRVPMDIYSQNWDHQAGRTCFDRVIDPELYAPFPVK